jgi:uncharacterized membrane protein YjjP (DUF1212 family)
MTAGVDRRRAVRLAIQLGILMLARGAQTQEVERALQGVLRGLRLSGADAVITNATVTVSDIAPGDAEATTAIQPVRDWRPDLSQLTAAAALAASIRDGHTDLDAAEADLDRILAGKHPYPRWLRFVAPAWLSFAVTIMFHGSLGDAAATLAIGLAIQPALEWIERSELPHFFQVVFGVAATALIVVLLVDVGLPIEGSLVLTGSLLRFLPGGELVSGMHDLIAGAYMSGIARLAEVLLLGAAIAGSASLVLAIGEELGVHLRITAAGGADWPAAAIVAAGAAAVAFNGCRLGVPPRQLLSVVALGALAVVVAQGFTPLLDELSRNARTLLAAVAVGMLGTVLAYQQRTPAAVWTVPAILPPLPAPATLLPLLAQTEAAREALQGQAVETAFAIGVGVATGSIAAATYQRSRDRYLRPVVDVMSDSTARRVVEPARRHTWRWRRSTRGDGVDDIGRR